MKQIEYEKAVDYLNDKLSTHIEKTSATLNEIKRTQKEIMQVLYDAYIEQDSQDYDVDVSVLIPIYNVENYLEECLSSLYVQKMSSVEFICINDGSTDGSLSIINGFLTKDNRFRLINKENTGYGSSMNLGLRAARGKYICILESDDVADNDMLSVLFSSAERYRADVVKARFSRFENVISDSYLEDDVTFDVNYGKYLSEVERYKIATRTPSIWSAIYRKDFLIKNDIRFLESPGASFQDISFSFITAICARRFVCIPNAVLFYRTGRDNSSVNSTEKTMCVCNEIGYIRDYACRNHLTNISKTIDHNLFLRYRWNYERLAGNARKEFGKIFAKEIKRIETEYSFVFEEWEEWEIDWFKEYVSLFTSN